MKKTKQSILDSARKLFNQSGYSRVTIRMIAQELNMSSGNLNYHFKKREDILEALYFEMVETFDERVKSLGQQDITLAHMKSQITSSMERMLDYQFFWTDLYFLLQSSESIQTHFQNVRADRLNGYQFVFNKLVQDKMMRMADYPNEHLYVIHRMLDYSNTWIYVSSIYSHQMKTSELIDLACFQLMSMMDSLLTEKGKGEVNALFADFYR
ncbi:MAG: TetR/AcrR family transcriptional regulator [Saprospiraceae bacterium]|nr:TetR/AcrR family transcriptional regulator [Saprospiraceae bacterium]